MFETCGGQSDVGTGFLQVLRFCFVSIVPSLFHTVLNNALARTSQALWLEFRCVVHLYVLSLTVSIVCCFNCQAVMVTVLMLAA
jgi:hypothetical protein